MSLLPPRRRDIPRPYEGADMPLGGAWTVIAEQHLRGLVVQQRERIKWLERELARTHALVYQAVGE
jgi:hypothetical protein